MTEQNTYDAAGNLLSDGENTYTYDLQNRLLTKTGADGVTRYEYDKSGNLTRETAPTGVSTYTYTAQNKLQKGVTATGQTSEYTYNALGVRTQNVQTRRNWNAGHMNVLPDNGSIYLHDYLPALSDNREIWQPTWETEVGTTVQNDMETVTKNYVTDYLSLANRDIMVKNEGQYVQRYVYGADSERISVQVTYSEKTQRGQSGENLASDFAANDTEKVWYRHSLLDSTLIAVDKNGEQVVHMSYDAWGSPETETKLDENFAGIDNLNNFTGYTYDETLELYFAQNRFYDPQSHRFTQEDPARDGENWYAYCGNSPTIHVDFGGLMTLSVNGPNNSKYREQIINLQKALEYLGYLNMGTDNKGNKTPYGTYGGATAGAVQLFRLNYGKQFSDSTATDEIYLLAINLYINKRFETSSDTDKQNLYKSYRNKLIAANINAGEQHENSYYNIYKCVIYKNTTISQAMNDKNVLLKVDTSTADSLYRLDITAPVGAMLLRNTQISSVLA